MCGIVGVLENSADAHVNQQIFDALTVLQHRGQDAAGMVTTSSTSGARLNLKKDNGLVKEVFSQDDMLSLTGNLGIGHVRYPTAGGSCQAEAQPLYTNFPHGICIAHNGTLTNTAQLRESLAKDFRHINTESDSEVLLNIFAKELMTAIQLSASSESKDAAGGSDGTPISIQSVFAAVKASVDLCKGGYAVVMLISGVGMLGFRDPNGIRPLVFGSRRSTETKCVQHVIASESVAIDALGATLERDIRPGEAILFDCQGNMHTTFCQPEAKLSPCIFEYVYFARPDSVIEGVQVYESRLRMGERLAQKIIREHPNHGIDVVIPIPDTSRTSALQCAYTLNCPYREGFIKNRYIARTFIMPGQETRKKNVRLKLNTIKSEFRGKNVLLVDDSIVRGTTSREIVAMARDCGPKAVFFVSAAPEIRHPNVYGIDIPTRSELIAHNRTSDEIARNIGVDWLIYQDLADLEDAVRSINPQLEQFESSCFSGSYVTPEVDDDYIRKLDEDKRNSKKETKKQTPNGKQANDNNGQSPAGDCESIHNDKRRKIGAPFPML